jgi:hypothetical protein
MSNFRIYSLFTNYTCGIPFRSYDDAYRYARRKFLTMTFYGNNSRYGIMKVDEYGNANSFDRWEI